MAVLASPGRIYSAHAGEAGLCHGDRGQHGRPRGNIPKTTVCTPYRSTRQHHEVTVRCESLLPHWLHTKDPRMLTVPGMVVGSISGSGWLRSMKVGASIPAA